MKSAVKLPSDRHNPARPDKDISRVVGHQLKVVRQRERWKQDAFAEAMGISQTTMSNIERGAQRIFVDQLYRAASILQVGINELLPPLEEVKQDDGMVRAAADDPLTPDAIEHLQDVIEKVTSGLQSKRARK